MSNMYGGFPNAEQPCAPSARPLVLLAGHIGFGRVDVWTWLTLPLPSYLTIFPMDAAGWVGHESYCDVRALIALERDYSTAGRAVLETHCGVVPETGGEEGGVRVPAKAFHGLLPFSCRCGE